jgi:hypothetical protein
MTTFVQFDSDQKEAVIGVFSCDQDPEFWPNMGEVEDDDLRLVAYLAAANIKGTL